MDDIIKHVREGNIVQVRMWLDNIENDINQGDEHRFSIIHWAAREGKTSLIELLVQRGARVNVTNMGDDTPLHLAASQGQLEAVKLLITLGANVNAVNEHGNTPLHYACFWNYVKVAKHLIKNNGLLWIQNKYFQTPLDKARVDMMDEYALLAESLNNKDLLRVLPYKDVSYYGTKARSKDQTLTKTEGSLDPKSLKLSGKIASNHGGEVWKGCYKDVDIVVKLLKLKQCNERHSRDFMEEYQRLKICNHINILPVIGVVNCPPKLCVVSYYQPYGSLYDVLHNTGLYNDAPSPPPTPSSLQHHVDLSYLKQLAGISYPQITRFALDVALGMQFLHSMDNKLANFRLNSKHIMIDEDIGKIYLPITEDEVDAQNKMAPQLTARLNMADFKFSFHEKAKEYNPAWISPEGLTKAPTDINIQASDMWSYGVILWELETRLVPCDEMSAMEIGLKIATEGMKLPYDQKTIANHAMRRLIHLCWQDDPGKRPKFDMLVPLLDKMKEKALMMEQESQMMAHAS